MERIWWQLPGPSSFLDLVEQDLEDGKNVVLALPAHHPPGVREALGNRIRRNELRRWRVLHLVEEARPGDPPLEIIRRRFLPEEVAARDSMRSLAESSRLRGMVLWVDGVDETSSSIWQSFLDQYEHFCRAISVTDRLLFLIPLVGASDDMLPADQVVLTVRRWKGLVERLDMAMFVSHLMRDHRCPALHRRVAIAVTVEIAQTDPFLARLLAQADLTDILEPFQLLTKVAMNRGWHQVQLNRPLWRTGMLDVLEGKEVVHSAALALLVNHDEIYRRIWRGQVSILFPFLEEQRQQLLLDLRRYISLPMETPFGTITDFRDLELGHLIYQLRGVRLPSQKWQFLKSLKEMRDALAHLEPVPSVHLLSISPGC